MKIKSKRGKNATWVLLFLFYLVSLFEFGLFFVWVFCLFVFLSLIACIILHLLQQMGRVQQTLPSSITKSQFTLLFPIHKSQDCPVAG